MRYARYSRRVPECFAQLSEQYDKIHNGLPAEIRDFLAGANDHAVLQHFTERRLRPLTIMPSDEEKIERFREMLAGVEYSA